MDSLVATSAAEIADAMMRTYMESRVHERSMLAFSSDRNFADLLQYTIVSFLVAVGQLK